MRTLRTYVTSVLKQYEYIIAPYVNSNKTMRSFEPWSILWRSSIFAAHVFLPGKSTIVDMQQRTAHPKICNAKQRILSNNSIDTFSN